MYSNKNNNNANRNLKKKKKKGTVLKTRRKKRKKYKTKKTNKKKTSSVLKPSIGEVTLPSKLQKKCLVQRDIKYMGSLFSTSEERLNKITTENLYHTKRLQASWYGSTLEEKKNIKFMDIDEA